MTDDGRLQLVDAHLHLWDLANDWYPAMQDPEAMKAYESLGDVTRMARDFLVPQLRDDAAAVEIAGVVHVSAVSAPRAHLDEARWLEAVLDQLEVPAVTVGSLEADQSRAEIEADLDAQNRGGRLRGARVLAGIDPANAAAADLCAVLEERGLVLDLVAQPAAVPAHLELLGRHPDLAVVLEHAGWPEATDEGGLLRWREAIGALAALPNLSCKVSGLGMATHALDADTLRPWLEGCLDAFGPGRCIFGSNFPVEAMYGGFDELVGSVSAVVDGLPEADRRAFWVENARRVYRI